MYDSFIFNEMFFNLNNIIKAENPSQEKILFGYDNDPIAIEKAKKNIERAGVSHLVHLECKNILELENTFNKSNGYIITNPPYGERMGNSEDLKEFYFQIGKVLKNKFSGYRFTLICGDKSLLGHFRLKADKEKNISISKLKGKFVSYQIQ